MLSKYKLWLHVAVSRHAWLLTISLQLFSSQPVWIETFEFQVIAQRPLNIEKTGNIDFFFSVNVYEQKRTINCGAV